MKKRESKQYEYEIKMILPIFIEVITRVGGI